MRKTHVMKNFIYLTIISFSILVSCKKDSVEPDPISPPVMPIPVDPLSVEKKNHAVVFYFGEDWCSSCGHNGMPTLNSLLSFEGQKLNGFQISWNSNNQTLNWPPGAGMSAMFNQGVFNNVNGIPAFAVNTTQQPLNSTMINQAIQKADSFNVQSVIAAMALTKSIENDTLTIETRVKFYENIPQGSNYSLALFVVEDSVIAGQSSYGGYVGNYVHRNLLRTVNGSDYSGTVLNNFNAIAKNETFENTFNFYIKPAWNPSHLKVIGVIWKRGTYPAIVINSKLIK